ncbi:MAG: glycosyltransferase family protein, partial [Stappiaceae bacterium]
ILQARMTSTRMHGKVLRRAAGRSVLGWVVRAMRATDGIDGVCVAIPEGSVHDPVADEAINLGVEVARGSELDVLNRFTVATNEVDAEVIMRVTTDCPLSDPSINARVLALLTEPRAQYACNNEPFSFPHGLDCEVFTREVLERANDEAVLPNDREHVTPWIKRQPDVRRRYLLGPGGTYANWRWTVDFPEDYTFFSAIAEALGEDLSDSATVTSYLQRNPHLHQINIKRRTR